MWSKLVGDHATLILRNGVTVSFKVTSRGLETYLSRDFFELGTPFLPVSGLLCVFTFQSFSTFKVEMFNVYGGEIEPSYRDDWYWIKKLAWRMNLPCKCSQSLTFVDEGVSVCAVRKGYTNDNSIPLARKLSKYVCGKKGEVQPAQVSFHEKSHSA